MYSSNIAIANDINPRSVSTLRRRGRLAGLLAGTAFAGVLMAGLGTAEAQQTLYWDGPNTSGNGNVTGGSGHWNFTTTNWEGSSGGHQTWQNGSIARFNGQGTVTVDTEVSVAGLYFYAIPNAQYTFQGADIRLASGTGNTNLVLNVFDPPITFYNRLTGSDRLTLVRGGLSTGLRVVFLNDNIYTGGTTLSDASIQLQLGNDTTVGTVEGQIDGPGSLTVYAPANNTRDFDNGIAGLTGTITFRGNGTHRVFQDVAGGPSTWDVYSDFIMNGSIDNANGRFYFNGTSSPDDHLSGAGAINLPNVQILGLGGTLVTGGDALSFGGLNVTYSGSRAEFSRENGVLGTIQVSSNLFIQGTNDLVINLDIPQGGVPDLTLPLIHYGGTLNGRFSRILVYYQNNTLVPEEHYNIDYQSNSSISLVLQNSLPDHDIYWNGSRTTPGQIVGGSGQWDLLSANWISADAQRSGPWQNGKTAIFSAAAGTVTVAVPNISAENLIFDTDGYSLTGDAITVTNDIDVATTATATLMIDLSGTTLTKSGGGTLVLVGNTVVNTLTVNGGTAEIETASPNTQFTGQVGGTGTFLIDATRDFSFGGSFTGAVSISLQGSGNITLANASGGHTGTVTSTNTGLLSINAALGGSFDISAGELTGTGLIGSTGEVLVRSGATLLPGGSGGFGQLAFGTDLRFQSTGVMSFDLGDNGSDLITVDGDLYLGGALLTLSQTNAAGRVFTLIEYTGTRNGLIDNLQNPNTTIVYADDSNQVLLLVEDADGNVAQYWNPDGIQQNSSSVLGGNGTWSTTTVNWTGSGGLLPGQTWANTSNDVAYFAGNGGTVTVASQSGYLSAAALYFSADYRLIPAAPGTGVELFPDSNGRSEVSVNNANGAPTVRFEAALLGSTILEKTGNGTLILASQDNQLASGIIISDGTLQIGDVVSNGVIAGPVSGSGDLDVYAGSGTTATFDVDFSALTGDFGIIGPGVVSSAQDNSGYAGTTTIAGGSTFSLGTGGALGGDIHVNGTLAGVGIASGVGDTVYVGQGAAGLLSPGTAGNQFGTLTIGGDLVMGANAVTRFDMRDVSAANDLVVINGNFTTNGSLTINVGPNAQYGTYTLFQFSGTLDNSDPFDASTSVVTFNGVTLGSDQFCINQPSVAVHPGCAGYQSGLITISILYLPPGGAVYWNGGSVAPNGSGTPAGGNGIWTSNQASLNWTDQNAATAYPWTNGAAAYFTNTGGHVTIDTTSNTSFPVVSVGGLYVNADGYTFVPTASGTDELTLVAPANVAVTFGIGDPNQTNITATFAVEITGSADLVKTGPGTLVLTAQNSNTGRTTISQGILQLGDGTTNGALGGEIFIDSTLVAMVNSSGAVMNNVFSGPGQFDIYAPTTTLSYTGSSPSFTGSLNLYNGTLDVGTGSAAQGFSAQTLNIGAQDSMNTAGTGFGALTLSNLASVSVTGTVYAGFSSNPAGTQISLTGTDPDPTRTTLAGGDMVLGMAQGADVTLTVDNAYLDLQDLTMGNAGATGNGVATIVNATIQNGGRLSADNIAIAAIGGSEATLTLLNNSQLTATGHVRIGGNPSQTASTGTLNVGGSLNGTANAVGPIVVPNIFFGAGQAELVFNHTGTLNISANMTETGTASGTAGHTIYQVAGTTTLTGASTAFNGNVNVNGGILNVLGNPQAGSGGLGGAFQVTDGTLAGTGTIASGTNGQVTIGVIGAPANERPTLSPGDASFAAPSYGELTIAGALLLRSNATVLMEFSDTSGNTADNDLITVQGTVSLGGALEVNIVNGVYEHAYLLITSTGGITNDFGTLTITFDGSQANNFDVDVQTNQVILTIHEAPTYTTIYWNGPNQTPTPSIEGGTGIWSAAIPNTNWTYAPASPKTGNFAWESPNTAYFTGTGGTVSVDSYPAQGTQTTGPIAVMGMTFDVDGYALVDAGTQATSSIGLLNTADGAVGGMTTFEVIGAAVSADVGVVLTGESGLLKMGTGTLILSADNIYQGITSVQEGVLQLGNGTNNGTIAGDVRFDATSTGSFEILANGTATFSARMETYNTANSIGVFLARGTGVGGDVVAFSGDGGSFLGTIWVYDGADLSLSDGGRLGMGSLQGSSLTVGKSQGATAPDSTGSLTLGPGAVLSTSSQIQLTTGASQTAALNFGAAAGDNPAEAGSFQTGSGISVGTGTVSVNFNHTGMRYVNAYSLAENLNNNPATLNNYSGYTNLTGEIASETPININGGVLNLNPSKQGTPYVELDIDVNNGGVLSGTSPNTILLVASTITVESGGTLYAEGGSNMNASASSLIFNDGTLSVVIDPTVAPAGGFFQSLTTVDISAGINVEVATANGAPLVVGQEYVLISSAAGITGTSTNITAPAGYSVTINGNNIVLSATAVPPGYTYWAPNGSPLGGDGTWTTANTNWSDQTLSNSGVWQQRGRAHFQGRSGTVTVVGTDILIDGMEFEEDYVLNAQGSAALTLSNGAGNATIDVSGSHTVNLNVPLREQAGHPTAVSKEGTGTLVFEAASTYTGGTAVNAGELQLGNGGASFAINGGFRIGASGILSVNTTGTMTFAPQNMLYASDSGAQFNIESGEVVVESANRAFMGTTNVESGGTLSGTGALNGDVNIAAGGTIAGSVGQSVFQIGGTLTMTGVQTSPSITNSSVLHVTLDQLTPNDGQALIVVDQLVFNNDAAAVTIDAANGGDPNDLAPGQYWLISYATGTVNVDYVEVVGLRNTSYSVINDAANNVVYLEVTTGGSDYLYWKPDTVGTIFGGQGIWSGDATSTQWSDNLGQNPGAWTDGHYAVFQGRAATVEVDSTSNGPVDARGMRFVVGGYTLAPLNPGDQILLDDGGAPAEISTADASLATIISVPLIGTADLKKTGPGELVLSGDNQYVGTTDVVEGTLALGNGGTLPGALDISSGATFRWENDATRSYGFEITGGGTFVKNTRTTLEIGYPSANFAGILDIREGTLTAATGNGVSGKIRIHNEGRLSGTGTWGDVEVLEGGTLFIGNSNQIGTMRVNSLTIDDGSVLSLTLSPTGVPGTGQASTIIAAEDIVVGDATVEVSIVTGASNVLDGDSFTIATSRNGQVSAGPGGLPSVSFDLPLIGRFEIKNNNTLILEVEEILEAPACELVGQPRNGCAVIQSLSRIDRSHRLLIALRDMEAEEMSEAARQLSGDVYATADASMIAGSRFIRDAAGRQVRASLGGVTGGAAVSTVSNYASEQAITPFGVFDEEGGGIGVWITGYGSWSQFDGNGNAGSLKDSVGGFLLGADAAIGGSMRLGAMFGFGATNFEGEGNSAEGNSNDYTFGVYGGGAWGGWSTDFGAAYTWHDVTFNRRLEFSTFEDRTHASYNAGTFQVYGDIGYTFDVTDGFKLQPYADASYIHQQSDAFTEAGGLAALTHQQNEMNTWFTTVGLRAAWTFDAGGFENAITAAAGWRHGFGDLDPTQQVLFAGGEAFGVSGLPLAEDQAVVSIDWQTELKDNVSIGVNYTGQFGGGYQSQSVSGRLNIRF